MIKKKWDREIKPVEFDRGYSIPSIEGDGLDQPGQADNDFSLYGSTDSLGEDSNDDRIMSITEKEYQLIQQGKGRPPLKRYITATNKEFVAVDNSCGENIQATFHDRESARAWLVEIHRFVQAQKFADYQQRLVALNNEAKAVSNRIEDTYQKQYQELKKSGNAPREIDRKIMAELVSIGMYSMAKIKMCIQSKSPEAVLNERYATHVMLEAQSLNKGIEVQQGKQLSINRPLGKDE